MPNSSFKLSYHTILLSLLLLLTACQPADHASEKNTAQTHQQTNTQLPLDSFTPKSEIPTNSPPLIKSARLQIGVTTSYDPTYRNLAFPRGDVAKNTGVCTDVVI